MNLSILDAGEVRAMQDEATMRWHAGTELNAVGGLTALVLENHRANFDLWHEEDKARDPLASDAEITVVKHAIDELNQRRNDLVEAMDDLLLKEVIGHNDEAPLHSETPGMMLDRMSILALKIYHTREESVRPDATPEHRARNTDRLKKLAEQRQDLAGCLDDLWREVQSGTRRFKLYRQLKMYNDPELNPVLYGRRESAGKPARQGHS